MERHWPNGTKPVTQPVKIELWERFRELADIRGMKIYALLERAIEAYLEANIPSYE